MQRRADRAGAPATLEPSALTQLGLEACRAARLRGDGEIVAQIEVAPSSNLARRWQRIAEGFAGHGLWPLVFAMLRRTEDRPWFAGEIGFDAGTDPADHDAAAVLSAWWAAMVPSQGESDDASAVLAPFDRRFPGLAPAIGQDPDDAAFALTVGETQGRLGVVGVTRPADAVAVLQWSGPTNHFSDMGQLAAVLRTWEDRFGAYVVCIGFDTLQLAVTRPPASFEQACRVAAEHMAVCSDCVYQGEGSIEALAESLVGASTWSFWWD
jgi:hypothetical protein